MLLLLNICTLPLNQPPFSDIDCLDHQDDLFGENDGGNDADAGG